MDPSSMPLQDLESQSDYQSPSPSQSQSQSQAQPPPQAQPLSRLAPQSTATSSFLFTPNTATSGGQVRLDSGSGPAQNLLQQRAKSLQDTHSSGNSSAQFGQRILDPGPEGQRTDSPESSASTPIGNPAVVPALSTDYFEILDSSQLYHVSGGDSNNIRAASLLNSQQRATYPSYGQSATASRNPPYSLAGVFNLAPPSTPFANSRNLSLSPIGQSNEMSQERQPHTLHRGASADSSRGFQCPNCSKSFMRDDLLRRHLAREARALAQPVVDRQKSCYECARSKARCDLEVPTCGRCQVRGKTCVYGARSGNPNLQRGSMRDTAEPMGDPSGRWSGSNEQSLMRAASTNSIRSSADESSDENRQSSNTFHVHRGDRNSSASSISTTGSYDLKNSQDQSQPHQQGPYDQSYHQDLYGQRTASPYHFSSGMGGVQPGVHLQRPYDHVSAGQNLGDHGEEGEVTPISRTNAASLMSSGSNAMGPPQLTPTRFRDATAMGMATSEWETAPGAMKLEGQPTQSSRPQPPRLLTGSKMPRPDGRSMEQQQGSARPLFSAQIDLSCWLEEPVIPSPLYRMGPSLSALAPGPAGGSMLAQTPTTTGGTAEALRSALAASNPPLPMLDSRHSDQGASADAVIPQTDNLGQQQPQPKSSEVESQVAARQWWAQSTDRTQTDGHVQGVAQACAGHFTIYPALMVLPDPTSPVPPLFHRPWLAHSRLHTPTSLARARVLLAGYHVKLPSSEGMVWSMIAAETNNLVAAFEQHMNASDLEVFSSTAALWFLIILLLMSSDPSSGAAIPDHLVDTSLIGLSQYARLLSQRILACEEARKLHGGTFPSFIQWGFEETMKRTLFASYSLLVLQRFRETSTEIQSQLAGIDVILDVPLPATALEFEAASELDWRACQHVRINDSPPGSGGMGKITMRDLLNARREGGGDEESRKKITSYFDRHDDFTNVCLSVAFALDRSIS